MARSPKRPQSTAMADAFKMAGINSASVAGSRNDKGAQEVRNRAGHPVDVKLGVVHKRKANSLRLNPSKVSNSDAPPVRQSVPAQIHPQPSVGAALKPKNAVVSPEEARKRVADPVKLGRQAKLNLQIAAASESFNFLGWESIPQKMSSAEGEIELNIGVDFGSTFTKVVISENSQRRSWAVPLSDNPENPFLLQSDVFVDESGFTLVASGERHQQLKMPFLSGALLGNEDIARAAAFLALVIRHAKCWFLRNKKDFLFGREPIWYVNAGFPARNWDTEDMVRNYAVLTASAVSLSESRFRTLSPKKVKEKCLETRHLIDDLAFEHLKGHFDVGDVSVGIFPEIMAQLFGFVRSDEWDRKRPEMMLVDVGGGTVDTTIFNVVGSHDEPTFAIFSSSVLQKGAIRLHEGRIDWLIGQLDGGGKKTKRSSEISVGLMSLRSVVQRMPDCISEYVLGAGFGEFTYDDEFKRDLRGELIGLLDYVLRKCNPRFGRATYPVFVAGGGMTNRVYASLLEQAKSVRNITIDTQNLPSPLRLEAEGIAADGIQRLSVAFGLSLGELGNLVTPSGIKDREIATDETLSNSGDRYTDRFVGSEQT